MQLQFKASFFKNQSNICYYLFSNDFFEVFYKQAEQKLRFLNMKYIVTTEFL